MKNLVKELNRVQKNLKCKKSQYNSFSNYYYRNAEDILEALKKEIGEDFIVFLEEEIVNIGDRFYVKATAILSDGENTIKASSFAREGLEKKGMDPAQLTGATSSYARKYALGALFLIDDSRDPDSQDNSNKEEEKEDNSKIKVKKGDLELSKCEKLEDFKMMLNEGEILLECLVDKKDKDNAKKLGFIFNRSLITWVKSVDKEDYANIKKKVKEENIKVNGFQKLELEG